MIFITGLIYAIFVKLILQHFDISVSYWFSYGIVLTLASISGDAAGDAIDVALRKWGKNK